MRFSLAAFLSRGALFAVLAIPAAGVEASAAPESGGELVRIEVEFFENGRKEPVNRATVFTSRRRVRIEQQTPGAANPPPVFIYRGDQDRLLSVVESSRSYLTIEPQLLERVGAGARTARREIDRQLDGIPEDQQRLFGHWMGASQLDPDRPVDPILITRGGPGDPVAGHACRQVRLSRSGRLLAAGCVADWDTVGLTPDDVEVFRSLALLARDAMASRSPIPKELVPGQPLDLILQLGGFPVYFERAGEVAGDNAIRVASVERMAANDALFEVPAGYTARTGMMGLASFASLLSRPGRGAPPAAIAPDADPVERVTPEAHSVPPKKDAPTILHSRPAQRAGRSVQPYRSISLFEER